MGSGLQLMTEEQRVSLVSHSERSLSGTSYHELNAADEAESRFTEKEKLRAHPQETEK